jgi:hypothetical protein
MRKTCAKPVEWVGMGCENENRLYSRFVGLLIDHVVNPQTFPNHPQKLSYYFPTAIFRTSHLLSTDLSTFYTGLITNTTKYI